MSSATKERLYTGIYECPSCDARYDLTDAYESDVICDDCGSDLEPAVDDESEDDELLENNGEAAARS